MRAASDPSVVAFAAQVLERHGGLVEPDGDRLLSVLPRTLAEELELPEEALLGGEQAPLLYGSPVLDRLIRLASREVPVVYGRIEVPYLKKDGFEQVLAQDLELVGGQARIVGRAETRITVLVLTCHYVAMSDERKEGLVDVAVNESSGVVLEGFESLWRKHLANRFETGPVPPLFDRVPERALTRALRKAEDLTQVEMTDFLTSMRRRLARDVKNTSEYFGALRKEMERSLLHPASSPAQQVDRAAKIAELPGEMQSKIEALQQKYSVRVSVTARAVIRLLAPVVSLLTQIRHRTHDQPLSLTWNPVTRLLDPLACMHCGSAVRRAFCVQAARQVRFVCSKCKEMY